jgi:GTP-binding protein LepA
VLRIARARNLRIIPVLNKIDLPAAQPDVVLAQLEDVGLDVGSGGREEAISVSAKTGQGVEEVLARLVRGARTHKEARRQDMRALVFDSWYDPYKGVVALASVYEGTLRKGEYSSRSRRGDPAY